jgi:hypothetical protein
MYMLVTRDLNAGQNRGNKIRKRIILKCVTDQVFGKDSNRANFFQEKIKRRLNYGNACYHFLFNLLL